MKHITSPAFYLFVVAAVATLLLTLVHALTLEPIENQLKITQEKTMIAVLSQADSFQEMEVKVSGNIVRVFEGTSHGERVGYVVELAPVGYVGPIEMMVGISSKDKTITGMRVVKHSETPGLGSLAVKESFYSKFDGRALTPLKVVKANAGENEIDAITASTITTVAITDAVNEAIEWYKGGGF